VATYRCGWWTHGSLTFLMVVRTSLEGPEYGDSLTGALTDYKTAMAMADAGEVKFLTVWGGRRGGITRGVGG
jgi:hypothetical protein